MIVCPRCGKDNQDHYKFCLGCGAELPRDHAGPKHFAAPTSPPVEAPPIGGSPSASPASSPKIEPTAPPLDDSPLPFATTQQGDADAMQIAALAQQRKPTGPAAGATNGGGRSGGSGSGAGGTGPRLSPPAATPQKAPAPMDNSALLAATPHGVPEPARPRPAPEGPVSVGSQPNIAPPPSASGPAVVSMRDCPACGDPVPADFRFCGSCGQRMDGAPSRPRMPASPAVAGDLSMDEASWGSLVLINPDGSEGMTYPLAGAQATIGRKSGGPFAADSYLSPRHAVFEFDSGRCVVRDQDSLNGVYYKIPRDTPVTLTEGSIFRIGQEILLFNDVPGPSLVGGVEPMGSPNPGYLGRISLVIGRESCGNSFLIPPDGAHIGRERGDVIFPEDGYVSGLHCRISNEAGRTVLTDVGSSNGTFVRLDGEHECKDGELLLMGQQLFRLQF